MVYQHVSILTAGKKTSIRGEILDVTPLPVVHRVQGDGIEPDFTRVGRRLNNKVSGR